MLGGQDDRCEWCRRGDFVNCSDQPRTGTDVDGGYAEATYARATWLVRIPPDLDALAGAPPLCAGLTVYNALVSEAARPGTLIAVQGIGGLGHLGVQYARALGHRVVAIVRGAAKAGIATELGAHDHIDSTTADPGGDDRPHLRRPRRARQRDRYTHREPGQPASTASAPATRGSR